jgi:hypothetical protein
MHLAAIGCRPEERLKSGGLLDGLVLTRDISCTGLVGFRQKIPGKM